MTNEDDARRERELGSGEVVRPRPDATAPRSKQAHPSAQAVRAELNHLIHLAGLIQAELPCAHELPGGMVGSLDHLAAELHAWSVRLEGSLGYLANPPPEARPKVV